MEAQVMVSSCWSATRRAPYVSHMLHHNLYTPLPFHELADPPTRPTFRSTPLGRPTFRRPSVVASFASLGFTADPRISIERAANNLLKDAASLLLYQEVLRVPPAQAFLKVLLALRRGDEGWKLLDAYGEFYKLMAAGHFLSWEDLILEAILAGEGNPFAEASANTGNSRSKWSRGAPPSLQAAAAADLDSLQRLSVTECTLVGWVTELVPDVWTEWKVAAESTLSSCEVKRFSSSSDKEKSSSDLNTLKPDGSLWQSELTTSPPKELSTMHSFCNDALTSNRETLRRKIGGLWRWSEAVPLLAEYYAQYGLGKIACEQVLQCKGGKLLRDASSFAYKCPYNLSIHTEHRGKLLKHFERHSLQSVATHILVHGPSGSGKTSLVKSAVHGSLKQGGRLRVVHMPKNETKHLQGVLEELAKNWQLRFILVIDGLSMIDELVFMDWPDNVMLCGILLSTTSQELNAKGFPDELKDKFGMVLTLDNLDLQSYLLCVEEMLSHNEKLGIIPSQGDRECHKDQAASWVRTRTALSVRTAARFVESIL